MQDRYTGDIGDFAKYGLLRAIARGRRLGVAWYLNSDGGPAGDGRHVNYLWEKGWRELDPELFESLKTLVRDDSRSVRAVQDSGLLGDCVFADDSVNFSASTWRDRRRLRCSWFEAVREKLADCDVVFADPDNGLVPDSEFKPQRRDAARRIPVFEATALARGRTAVIYHHNSRRKGGHREEIRYWLDETPGASLSWYWRRVSNRTFFILNPDEEVSGRLEEFASRWKDHGELVRR